MGRLALWDNAENGALPDKKTENFLRVFCSSYFKKHKDEAGKNETFRKKEKENKKIFKEYNYGLSWQNITLLLKKAKMDI